MQAIAIVSGTWRVGPATRGRRLWRQLVSWMALLALAWPSLGPLPWLAARGVVHAHAAPAHEHRHVDVSAIPGTPTHPDDHDCAECQVLKHLARCVPTVATIDFTVAAAVAVVALPFRVELPSADAQGLLPPVRAPPAAIA